MQHFASPSQLVGALTPSEPVYCLREEPIRHITEKFVNNFPGDTMFAVKSNPLPRMLSTLSAAGITRFDTASIGEIELVSTLLPEADKYFMHPVKSREAIAHSFEAFGTRHFVIDHVTELDKITQVLGRQQDVMLGRRRCVNA